MSLVVMKKDGGLFAFWAHVGDFFDYDDLPKPIRFVTDAELNKLTIAQLKGLLKLGGVKMKVTGRRGRIASNGLLRSSLRGLRYCRSERGGCSLLILTSRPCL